MQQANQAFAVSVAAVRRSNCLLLCLTCLPLATAYTVLAGVRGVERLSHARTREADRRLGNLKQSQAAALAQTLCTRVAGAPAEVLDLSGHRTNIEANTDRQWNEWQVECRTHASRYLLRLDANRREVLVIVRETQENTGDGTESAAGEAGAQGDLPAGRLPHREAQLFARRYLSLVGLPLPADARLVRNQGGYDFVYQCDSGGATAAAGQRRMLRVRIDPRDGSLVHLQNVLYRRTPRNHAPVRPSLAAAVPHRFSQR